MKQTERDKKDGLLIRREINNKQNQIKNTISLKLTQTLFLLEKTKEKKMNDTHREEVQKHILQTDLQNPRKMYHLITNY